MHFYCQKKLAVAQRQCRESATHNYFQCASLQDAVTRIIAVHIQKQILDIDMFWFKFKGHYYQFHDYQETWKETFQVFLRYSDN